MHATVDWVLVADLQMKRARSKALMKQVASMMISRKNSNQMLHHSICTMQVDEVPGLNLVSPTTCCISVIMYYLFAWNKNVGSSPGTRLVLLCAGDRSADVNDLPAHGDV